MFFRSFFRGFKSRLVDFNAFFCKFDVDVNIVQRSLSTSKFDNLKNLELCCYGIDKLTCGLFDSMCQLKKLNLPRNDLKRIPRGLFDNLVNLVSLILDSNPIETIKASALSGIVKFTAHELRNCRLKSIDSRMLAGLVALTKLVLAYNATKAFEVVDSTGLLCDH